MGRKFKIRALKLTLSFLVLILAVSCEEDDPVGSGNILVSGDVIYLSGERVRLLGRIFSFSNTPSDHGFEISLDESFTNPTLISLGELQIPGRFIGEYSGLNISSEYFFRSYMVVNGQTVYGDATPFNTLTPFINSFSPQISRQSNFITINGGNFTEDTKVFIGTEEALVQEIVFESEIVIQIPSGNTNNLVDVTVRIQDTDLVFDTQFEYITGVWQVEGEFVSDLQITNSAFVERDDRVIFGLGFLNELQTLNDKFWRLDKSSLSWSELEFSGTPVESPYTSPSGFGSGRISSGFGFFLLENDSWTIDLNDEFVPAGELPFELFRSLSFEHNDQQFVLGGVQADFSDNLTIYRSPLGSNDWEIVGVAPVAFNSQRPSFLYNDHFYMFSNSSDLWKYDPQTNEFSYETSNDQVMDNSVGVVIGDKLIVGMGRDTKIVEEYDLSIGVWKPKNVYPGIIGEFNSAWWTNEGKMYVLRTNLRNFPGSSDRMEIWSLDPDKL